MGHQNGQLKQQFHNKKIVLMAAAILFATFIVIGAATGLFARMSAVHGAGGSFVFGAAGDQGADQNAVTPGTQASRTLKAIGASNLDFFQALGDLNYGQNTPAQWCQFVKDNINIGAGKSTGDPYGNNYKYMLVAGNHEAKYAFTAPYTGGHIEDFTANGCLPNQIPGQTTESPHIDNFPAGMTNYGKEYYYDYPATTPIARFINVVPHEIFDYNNGNDYDYSAGSNHYNWVSNAIDSARASGVKWIILAYHEPYINSGDSHGNDSGLASTAEDLFNLAVSKKVDLILNGHEHSYQRTKQLAFNGTSCTHMSYNSYNANCVVDSGNALVKGAGTVQMIIGTGGDTETNSINTSDADFNYMKKAVGPGDPDETWGFSKFQVTDTSMTVSFVPAVGDNGGMIDNFTITDTVTPPADTTKPTVALTAPTSGSTVSGTIPLTATASDNVDVTKVEFYNGATKLGESTTSPYTYSWNTTAVANGSYTLSATAYDAAGNNQKSADVTVTVSNNAPNLSPDTHAPSASLTSPANGATVSGASLTITATAQDDTSASSTETVSGVSKVEFYVDGSKVGEDLTSPYSIPWNTTTVSNGSHALRVTVIDGASNSAQSSIVTVTVNNQNTPPTDPTPLKFEFPGVSGGTEPIAFTVDGTCADSIQGQGSAAVPQQLKDHTILAGAAFTVNCGATGTTAQVRVQLAKAYTSGTLTAFKQSGSTIQDVTSHVTFTTESINGGTVSVMKYTLQDGGFGDEDGAANGQIADPIFVTFTGTSSDVSGGIPQVPKTGFRLILSNPIVVVAGGIFAAFLFIVIGRKLVTQKTK